MFLEFCPVVVGQVRIFVVGTERPAAGNVHLVVTNYVPGEC
jgi:hypothetical protein